MSREDLVDTKPEDRRIGGRQGDRKVPEGHPDRGFEPPRHDDLSGPEEQWIPKERVIGMAGILDTARYKAFICRGTGHFS